LNIGFLAQTLLLHLKMLLALALVLLLVVVLLAKTPTLVQRAEKGLVVAILVVLGVEEEGGWSLQ
jgi:hypothetical protein